MSKNRGGEMQISMGVLISIIALVCTIIGAVIGIFTFTRNRDKDVKTDASESAVIRTKLDAINLGVESIRIDMKVEQKERMNLSERVVRVEESNKQAHKRIDFIENERG